MRFGLLMAAAASFVATNVSAFAEPPTCGAPTTIDILRTQVKEHFDPSKSTGNESLDQLNRLAIKVYLKDGDFDVRVDQMFATSRSEDVRECRASMHLAVPGRVSGDSPVFYSVTRSEDGHDLVAINGDQALYSNLLQSLEANNSDLRENLNAFRRDLFRSSNRGIGDVMQANPNLNRPAPAYPGTSLKGTGNAGRRFRQENN